MLKDAWFLERNKIPDPSIPDSIDTNRRKNGNANKQKNKKKTRANETKENPRSDLCLVSLYRLLSSFA